MSFPAGGRQRQLIRQQTTAKPRTRLADDRMLNLELRFARIVTTGNNAI